MTGCGGRQRRERELEGGASYQPQAPRFGQ